MMEALTHTGDEQVNTVSVDRFIQDLSILAEQPQALEQFSLKVLEQKTAILEKLGILSWDQEITSHGGDVQWAQPEKIEGVILTLSEDARITARTFQTAPSEALAIREFALVSALSELTILGPTGISSSMKLHRTDPSVSIGVQQEQIQSAVSIATMHSNEVASGQGKSFLNIPIAAVTRNLLAGTQIHVMVKDTQSRIRDSENILKLTLKLSLSSEALQGGEELLRENERAKVLILVSRLLTLDRTIPQSIKEQKQLELNDELEQILLTRALERSLEKANTDIGNIPDIVIGTDYDFVFDRLKGKTARFWQDGASVIADEGDLFWERDSTYILTDANSDVLASYLPDWIASSAAHGVCQIMEQKNLLTKNEQGSFEFKDREGNDTDTNFNDSLAKKLSGLQKHGILYKPDEQALLQSLQRNTSEICQEFDINFSFDKNLARKIVQIYAPDPILAANWIDSAGLYQTGWITAQRLTLGSEFGSTGEATYVIDKLTGERLAGHQFSGQTDVAIDIHQHVCALRPRGSETQNSIGFLAFLDEAYGKGNISLVSGTLTHITDEIREFTGHPVIVTDRWIGKPIDIPSYDLLETRESALTQRLNRELNQFLQTGRPTQIICENDEELKFLYEYIKNVIAQSAVHPVTQPYLDIVTSDIAEDRAKEIYERAGQAWSFTLTNPKGSRAISVPTSSEAEKLGGLKIHVWGPLTSNAVLRQALARTRRAGNNGEVTWTVYKSQGNVALLKMPSIREHSDLREKVEKINPGTFSYKGSNVEALHTQRTKDFALSRLSVYKSDYLTREFRSALYGAAQKTLSDTNQPEQKVKNLRDVLLQMLRLSQEKHQARPFVTNEYIQTYVREKFGVDITEAAMAVAQSIHLSDGTYNSLIDSLARAQIEQREAKEMLIRETQKAMMNEFVKLQQVRRIHMDLLKVLLETQISEGGFIAQDDRFQTSNTDTIAPFLSHTQSSTGAMNVHTLSFVPVKNRNLVVQISKSELPVRDILDPEKQMIKHVFTVVYARINSDAQIEESVPFTTMFDEDQKSFQSKKKLSLLKSKFDAHAMSIGLRLNIFQETIRAMNEFDKNTALDKTALHVS